MFQKFQSIFSRYKLILGSFVFFFIFAFTVNVFAVPPDDKYSPGATLDPNCIAGSTNCTVLTQSFITAGTTSQYYRGDKTWATLSTTNVSEGDNLYFTNARVDTRLLSTTSIPNLATIGTIASGTWNGSIITDAYISDGITASNYVPLSSLGVSSGVATLDSSGKIPTSQLTPFVITDTFVVASQVAMLALSGASTGDVAVRTDTSTTYVLASNDYSDVDNWIELLTPLDNVLSINGLTGAVSLTTSNISEGTNLYFTNTRADDRISLQKGQPSGLATLDSSGKIPTSQLSSLPLNETFVVASQVAMLALSASQGDLAVRTDEGKTYVLSDADATDVDNWVELLSSASVASVNGSTGAITLTTSNISEGTNLYFTNTRARQSISVSSAPLAYNNSTGALSITASSALADGYLSASDWSTFNDKQDSLVTGNLTSDSTGLSVSGGTGSIIGSGVTLTLNDASVLQKGAVNTSTQSFTGAKTFVSAATFQSTPVFESMTSGSILFAGTGGALSQSNANFYFDSTTNANYLKIGSGTAGGQIQLLEGSGGGSEYVALKAPSTVSTSVTWTLPSADGSSGQVLSTDGSGALSWATASGGGLTIDTTTITGGADTQISYNKAGVVGSEAAFVYDYTNNRLGLGATPSATAHFLSTTEQLRVGYDASNYASTTISSTGAYTQNVVNSGGGAYTISINSAPIFKTNTSAAGYRSTFIGYRAGDSNTSDHTTALGYGANRDGTGQDVISIGAAANYNGQDYNYSLFIGSSGSSSTGMQNTAANQAVIGMPNGNGYTQFYFGQGVSVVTGTPSGVTFNATPGTTAGGAFTIKGGIGSGTNIVGGALTLAGGASTGSAVGGDIIFQTSTAGSTGSTLQTLATRWTISGTTGNLVSSNSAGTIIGHRTTSGSPLQNTYISHGALGGASGSYNVVVGENAGLDGGSGSANTILGRYAGRGALSGSNNIIIGSTAAGSSSATMSNVLIIGSENNSVHSADLVANDASIGMAGSSGGYQQFYFGQGKTKANPSNITLQVTGGSGADNAGASMILAGGKGTGNASSGSIFFQTSTAGASSSTLQTLATRMTVYGLNGYVGIGTATPAFPLDVASTVSSSQTYGYLNSSGVTGTASGSNSYSISATGRILASEFNAISDERLKDVQFDIDSAVALDLITQLRPVSFTWKNNPEGQPVLGLLAQEVEQIIPNAVSQIETSNFSDQRELSYNQLTAVAIGAIKELDLIVEGIQSVENSTFIENIIEWFADATNGITEFIAGTVRAKDKVCVGETCITESQLIELMSGQNYSSGGTSQEDGNGSEEAVEDIPSEDIIDDGMTDSGQTEGSNTGDISGDSTQTGQGDNGGEVL